MLLILRYCDWLGNLGIIIILITIAKLDTDVFPYIIRYIKLYF